MAVISSLKIWMAWVSRAREGRLLVVSNRWLEFVFGVSEAHNEVLELTITYRTVPISPPMLTTLDKVSIWAVLERVGIWLMAWNTAGLSIGLA